MSTSVKRLVTTLMAFAIIASSFALGGARAHAQDRTKTNVPGKWGSAILIQNTGTGTLASGDYSITFYDTAGTQAGNTYTPSASIPTGSSKEFYIPDLAAAGTIVGLGAGQYSAVISSAQKVKAVVNSSTDRGGAAPWSAFSYEGIDSDSTSATLYFPAFYRDYYKFLSELVIQNTDSSATATVSATFYNGLTGAKTGPIALGDIPHNASKTYSWNDTAFKDLATGNTAIYGVVITSNAPLLAGVSNIWSSDTTNYGVGSYNAFTTGNPTVYLGALYNQYYGFVSSLTVQNLSSTTAKVTIAYSDGTTSPSFDLAGNTSKEIFQPNVLNLASGNSGGLLSATITATGGNIVSIVNIQRKARGSISVADPTNPAFGSYSGTSIASSVSVSVPAIFNNYFGYFTAVTVKNTGDQPTTITLTYADGTTWKQDAAKGATVNFSHVAAGTTPGTGVTGNPRTKSEQTAGTVTSSPAQPLVVVIQHNTDSKLSSYRSTMAPNDFLFVLSGFPN
ncbi:MAG: hypothetical protein WCI67_02105 [Chloroflexales bacterium]